MTAPRKIAIIGSGITGLGAAHALQGSAQITLFEAGSYFGGHSNTVDISLPTPHGERTHGIDTGFLVYNERTYPNLIALFEQLGTHTTVTDMSFSVQGRDGERALEWGGANLNTVFAQRGNLFRPRFLKMLLELLRLNKLCTQIAVAGTEAQLAQPLSVFLAEHRFGQDVRDWYLLPMLGCIWSCPTEQMLQFPVSTMIRFCHNHGLMQVNNRPKWWTVTGGSRNYVKAITDKIADKRLNTPVQLVERDGDGVRVVTQGQAERFDRVIFATHAPQALAMLRDAGAQEREILGEFRTQPNQVVLHTDASVLPKSKLAWSAWNYVRGNSSQEGSRVCLHYLINKLQPIPFQQAVVVSLNPTQEIARSHIHGVFEYAHPVMDLAATRAQARLHEINGANHAWFCGAWTRYGFHEDGLMSGLAAARAILKQIHGAAA
ncbi:FAD-dependent oxidoreductase [Variovorax sp. PCZ-1]|uniref:NAD(P)/FAD-dependent oxidoreductase n=1 Tax=Variovorax sp. PCZ-1 TaxID=2835533 RepID=UPI001BCA7018|nr:FAD-dependent oxidoreductase [Variovorax sp. PCZ-1]MBS7808650.1 FAD-dependent oxidoreductase [Variovorax sp. PCZ-1]